MVDVVSRNVHHSDEQASHSNWCICVWVCERERKSKKEQLVHGGKEAFNLKKWSFQKDAFKWMLTFLETKRLSPTSPSAMSDRFWDLATHLFHNIFILVLHCRLLIDNAAIILLNASINRHA